jgi:hypothetical protein
LTAGGQFIEPPPVRRAHRGLTGPVLPAANDHVHVLGIEFHQPRPPAGFLGGDQCGAGVAEGIQYRVARSKGEDGDKGLQGRLKDDRESGQNQLGFSSS